ncbi:glutathione S-transferase family protein [Sinirhodobacter populi]|uniref:Glutathione S-transferase family protein n=1 Tax=Paenirhodobacter populi TaxID=2306993 RepID=A0A443KH58_9RHOB|nr:glutathione S-transferase family protein [Sinirhodobacter populi]RWR32089.1 glutathione S-transferase family protein [Sinirhodobacter populi]
MLQLHYFPDNASLAPHLLLVETRAQYELKLVDRRSDAQKSADYLKLNPAGRIPTLVHGNLVLFESPAICIYICEQDSTSRFIPPQAHRDRPVFFQWLAYLNNTLQTEYMLWRYAEKHTTEPGSVETIKAAQAIRLVEILALLNAELGRKRFMLGDQVYGCDHFLFMLALWCENLPRPTSSYENLSRFMREMSQRPAVQQVCKIENISLLSYSA